MYVVVFALSDDFLLSQHSDSHVKSRGAKQTPPYCKICKVTCLCRWGQHWLTAILYYVVCCLITD